jgi:hypothetical protein
MSKMKDIFAGYFNGGSIVKMITQNNLVGKDRRNLFSVSQLGEISLRRYTQAGCAKPHLERQEL